MIVTPKPVVNDPQGLTVKQGLRQLGFDEVADVRVGKYIEVRLTAENADVARKRVKEMCLKLLANHVIEDFRFEVDPQPFDAPARRGEKGDPDESVKEQQPS